MKRGIVKVPDYSSASATQMIKEYPYTKPQTIHRYGHNVMTEAAEQGRKSFS
jgi:hypothetical protein